ncbi:MAG: uroporphyrinogen decarboxylase family protein [Kiritimatiellae bacterium]|nr:uroporphyrinogen decarboxylase family protein [Kiritimatiellia bacterium]
MKFLPVLSFPIARKLGHSVGEFVKSADFQAETMAWIARNTPVDAVLGPMDLSVEAEAFGANVRFSDHEVPVVTGQLVEDEDAVAELAIPAADAGRCSMTVSAVAKVKAMDVGKPVFGGMIGPFSLAGRLADVNEMMFLLMDEPETVHALLEKTTSFLSSYAKAFKAAGADGVFMAEPLAGVISPAALEEFSAPYVRRLVEGVQDATFPLVYHNCGNSVVKAADAIFAQGASGCHFGNAIDLSEMLAKAPSGTLVMGNVDPVSVLAQGTPSTIREAVDALVAKCGSYPNFVISSGCDIPATTPWENVEAFCEAARHSMPEAIDRNQ